MDSYLGNMYNQFVKNGIPVIIGEFGCVDKNNADQRLSWAKYYVETCTKYGIKCFWWDNGTQYKIFNRRTLKVTEPELLNTMLAEAKGEEYKPDTSVKGDANNDGVCNIKDVVMLQGWLVNDGTKLINGEAVDLCADERINVFDLIMLKRLLMAQDNICASEDNWNAWTDTANGAEAEMNYISNGISMSITNGGKNDWDVQASYTDLTFEEGASYQISFDYTSTAEQSMMFHIMQNHDDYKPYYSATLDYSTDVKHFDDTFTMTASTDKNS